MHELAGIVPAARSEVARLSTTMGGSVNAVYGRSATDGEPSHQKKFGAVDERSAPEAAACPRISALR